jgi:hypothetical protein
MGDINGCDNDKPSTVLFKPISTANYVTQLFQPTPDINDT